MNLDQTGLYPDLSPVPRDLNNGWKIVNPESDFNNIHVDSLFVYRDQCLRWAAIDVLVEGWGGTRYVCYGMKTQPVVEYLVEFIITATGPKHCNVIQLERQVPVKQIRHTQHTNLLIPDHVIENERIRRKK